MKTKFTDNALRSALTSVRLSDSGVLYSTGIRMHLDRLRANVVDRDTLLSYAADLNVLTARSACGNTAIPVDFWDVRTSAMLKFGFDEYRLVSALSRHLPGYVEMLGACFANLLDIERKHVSAVSAAMSVLRRVSEYVCSPPDWGVTLMQSWPTRTPEQNAIFLWQQIISGTNRQIPYLNRDAYTHGVWSRFNVVEMLRYHLGTEVSVDQAWGLTGFSERFIGDPTNTNQIEHMAISAVAQSVLRIPTLLLDLLEEMEWMLGKGTSEASRADERVNRAVARCLLPGFRVDDPGPSCARLEQELSS